MMGNGDTQLKNSHLHLENPPVVETAIGLQFEEILNFKTIHFGQYYETIADRFPLTSDQPRLEQITESFPNRKPGPGFGVRFENSISPHRVWYTDKENGSFLLQLQPDRFGFNWRRGEEASEYPSFSENCNKCLEEFSSFQGFCHEKDLGDLQLNLCEIVYVNKIWPNADDKSITDLYAKVFAGLSFETFSPEFAQPEALSYNRTFPIERERGRLYAQTSVANDEKRGDYILWKMVARVLFKEGDEVKDALQLAHEWVVRAFTALTKPELRKDRWGEQS